MVWVVEHSPRAARLELIRAHPDLAVGAGGLTPQSTREQSAAGLDGLAPAERERIARLTAAYRERFGFPFVVCAREHTPDSIARAAAERLEAAPEEEERTAIAEIAKIARLRLDDLVA
jgi:OHCU decarboxylase